MKPYKTNPGISWWDGSGCYMFEKTGKTSIRYFQQPPLPGNWYVDKTGALFKVKALVFEEGQLDHAIVDYPRGPRRKVLLSQWHQFIYQASMPTSSGQQQTL